MIFLILILQIANGIFLYMMMAALAKAMNQTTSVVTKQIADSMAMSYITLQKAILEDKESIKERQEELAISIGIIDTKVSELYLDMKRKEKRMEIPVPTPVSRTKKRTLYVRSEEQRRQQSALMKKIHADKKQKQLELQLNQMKKRAS